MFTVPRSQTKKQIESLSVTSCTLQFMLALVFVKIRVLWIWFEVFFINYFQAI